MQMNSSTPIGQASLIAHLETHKYSNELDLTTFYFNEENLVILIKLLPLYPNYTQINIDTKTIHASITTKIRLKSIIADRQERNSPIVENTFVEDTKDKYGNEKQRVLFETELARSLLEDTASKNLYSQINCAIISYVEKNIEVHKKLAAGFSHDLVLLNMLNKHDVQTDAVKLFINLLSQPLTPKNLCVMSEIHKIFFENYFNPELVKAEKPQQPCSTLGLFAQKSLRENIDRGVISSNPIYKLMRQDSQFSDNNRGRIVGGSEKPTSHFGINDDENIPAWANEWHDARMARAKDAFRRDVTSPQISYCEKYNIPFISGPSGTVGFVVTGIMLMMGLSAQQLKEYSNILAATLIGSGHHSYFEVMQVFANLKVFHFFKTPESFCNSAKAEIHPEHIYETCLTDDFKKSDAYQKLAADFPQFLPAKNRELALQIRSSK